MFGTAAGPERYEDMGVCIFQDECQGKGLLAAIRAPMIVSRPAPTVAAVETDRNVGITLLGFSQENCFSIYSASHQLKNCNFTILPADEEQKNHNIRSKYEEF